MVMCKKDVLNDEIIRECFVVLDEVTSIPPRLARNVAPDLSSPWSQDGNGTVSLSELKTIMLNPEGNAEHLTADECAELFAEIDTNRDRNCSMEEITNYIRGRTKQQ